MKTTSIFIIAIIAIGISQIIAYLYIALGKKTGEIMSKRKKLKFHLSALYTWPHLIYIFGIFILKHPIDTIKTFLTFSIGATSIAFISNATGLLPFWAMIERQAIISLVWLFVVWITCGLYESVSKGTLFEGI